MDQMHHTGMSVTRNSNDSLGNKSLKTSPYLLHAQHYGHQVLFPGEPPTPVYRQEYGYSAGSSGSQYSLQQGERYGHNQPNDTAESQLLSFEHTADVKPWTEQDMSALKYEQPGSGQCVQNESNCKRLNDDKNASCVEHIGHFTSDMYRGTSVQGSTGISSQISSHLLSTHSHSIFPGTTETMSSIQSSMHIPISNDNLVQSQKNSTKHSTKSMKISSGASFISRSTKRMKNSASNRPTTFPRTSEERTGQCVCGICSDSFPTVDELCSHLLCHTTEMPYVCGVCGVGFFEGTQLLKHVCEYHCVKDPYRCGDCCTTFPHKVDFIEHIKHCSTSDKCTSNQTKASVINNVELELDRAEEALDDECVDDAQGNETEVEQQQSIIQSNEDSMGTGTGRDRNTETIIVGMSADSVSFKKKATKLVMDDVDLDSVCTVIVEPSTAGGSRKKHLYQCKFCDRVCRDRCQMTSHARCHMTSRPYQCEVCSRTFKEYSHLREHMRRHTKEKPYVCDRCAKSFPRRLHLYEHIRRIHSEDRLFECPDCTETFQTRQEFCKHKKTHKQKYNLQCLFCSKQFSNNTDYQRHCLTHTKEKRFECELCHMKFALLANAKKHMKVHGKQQNAFNCSSCSKSFRYAGDLKRHELIHRSNNDLAYPCQDCNRSFKTLSKKKLHALCHSKEKLSNHSCSKLTWHCKTCGEQFGKKSDLRNHGKSHKGKKFTCEICEKSFTQKSALVKHVESHVIGEMGIAKAAYSSEYGKQLSV